MSSIILNAPPIVRSSLAPVVLALSSLPGAYDFVDQAIEPVVDGYCRILENSPLPFDYDGFLAGTSLREPYEQLPGIRYSGAMRIELAVTCLRPRIDEIFTNSGGSYIVTEKRVALATFLLLIDETWRNVCTIGKHEIALHLEETNLNLWG